MPIGSFLTWSNAMRMPTLMLITLVCLFAASVSPVLAQPQKKPRPPMPPDPPMVAQKAGEKSHQKWEYRTEYAANFYTINTFEDAKINKLGAEGWELVAIN